MSCEGGSMLTLKEENRSIKWREKERERERKSELIFISLSCENLGIIRYTYNQAIAHGTCYTHHSSYMQP